jgi:glycine cleavage system H lipoate-binding protein
VERREAIAHEEVELKKMELTVPIDRHGVATHEALDCTPVEVADEQGHVLVELAAAVQEVGEALDGHVGEGEEAVEDDPKLVV